MSEEQKILHRLAGWSFTISSGAEFFLWIPGRNILDDIDSTKLIKERDYLWDFMLKLKNKLENENFINKAPQKIIDIELKKWNDCWDRFYKIDNALNYLNEISN
jgi:valyl-tRNA synthetase